MLEGWAWGAAGRRRKEVSREGWVFWEGTSQLPLCFGEEAGKEAEEEGGWGHGWWSGCCGGVRYEAEGCSRLRAG